MRLLYFADPLCSWCYGFGPELAALLARHPETDLALVMGGLRPYNTQPMSEAFKDMLRGHWKHVAEASGLPFSGKILEREGFIYDTEPACRAVVTARTMDASRAFAYMKAIQSAFYDEGRDVTRPGALADLAAECGYRFEDFVPKLGSDEMKDATRRDFETTQAIGVGGFPTVAVAHGDQLFLVTSGFAKADVVEDRLGEIERRIAADPRAS